MCRAPQAIIDMIFRSIATNRARILLLSATYINPQDPHRGHCASPNVSLVLYLLILSCWIPSGLDTALAPTPAVCLEGLAVGSFAAAIAAVMPIGW
jgi:hypothetical protein